MDFQEAHDYAMNDALRVAEENGGNVPPAELAELLGVSEDELRQFAGAGAEAVGDLIEDHGANPGTAVATGLVGALHIGIILGRSQAAEGFDSLAKLPTIDTDPDGPIL